MGRKYANVSKPTRSTAVESTGSAMDARLMTSTNVRLQQMDDEYAATMEHRAARCIASQAHDADDCAELLAMFGLTASDGKAR